MKKKRRIFKGQARVTAPVKTVRSKDRGAEHKAARRATEAACNYGKSFLRTSLTKRSHRKPSDLKVDAYFQVWVVSGGFFEFASSYILDLLREFQSEVGRPGGNWTHGEHLEAFDRITRYFNRRSELLVKRPRGRPRHVKSSGLIASKMLEGANERRISARGKLESLVDEFLRIEEIIKLGHAAKWFGSGKSHNTLMAARQYFAKLPENDKQEIKEQRLPRGSLQYLMTRLGIDPKHQAAFKMRVSRARPQST